MNEKRVLDVVNLQHSKITVKRDFLSKFHIDSKSKRNSNMNFAAVVCTY